MATCAECGEGVQTTYDCRDCGDAFCVDCRLPDDHDCVSTERERAQADATDGGTVQSPEFSLPTAPRITALLPAWRAIPWFVQAVLAFALLPMSLAVTLVLELQLVANVLLVLSPVVLAQHVYHERVATAIDAESGDTDAAEQWTPSWVYYFPLALTVFARLVGDYGITFLLGGFPALIAALVYIVQKARHSR